VLKHLPSKRTISEYTFMQALRIFIDLDGVIADFNQARKNHPLRMDNRYKGRPDMIPNIYKDLEPMPGAIMAVNELLDNPKFDIYFLSSAPWDNPDAWTHKRLWLTKHFDENKIRKRLILSHHKNFMIGDYLIDDREVNGANLFEGELLKFRSPLFPNWDCILKYLNSI